MNTYGRKIINEKTVFNFGRYQGKNAIIVLLLDPGYIKWNLNHDEEFYINESLLSKLIKKHPEIEELKEIKKLNTRNIKQLELHN